MKKLIFTMVLSVFLGTQILAVHIGFKLSLYRILFLVVSYGFLLMFINNDQRLRFYPRKVSSMYTMFYGSWLLYSLSSIIWAESLAGWAKANVFIGIGVLSIFFIQLFIKDKKDLLTLFRSIVLGISIHLVLGFSELLTGKYIWASNHFMTKYQPASGTFFTRIPISIFPNQNDYATALLMGFFFILILLNNSKNIFSKLGYGLLLVSTVFLIYQTDSRGNLVAVGIGLFAMTVVYFMNMITKKVFFSVAGGAVGVSAIALLISSSLRGKLMETFSLFLSSAEYSDTSNQNRVNLIKNGFNFLRESFGFGIGAGNVEYWMKNYPHYLTGGITNMHNWWMEILTGYGIFVFLFYVIVYVGMIVKGYHYYQNSSDAFIRKTSLGIIGYLAAFTLSSISSASNIVNEWQWVVFGVIIAFYAYCERVGSKKVKQTNEQLFNQNKVAYKATGGSHGQSYISK